MKQAYEIYPNAPLVESVFEITFSGDPTIECQRDKFYNEIRGEYPNVLVPIVREGMALPLEPYRFEKNDGSYSIGISINKLFLSCKRYEGYSVFKKEILKIFSLFNKLFPNIISLRRTGLRYINIIPFTRENRIIPIESYLNIKINLPKAIPPVFKNLSISFVSQTEGGNITTRIEPVVSPNKAEAIMLDFDYAKEGELKFDSIIQYLEESHKHTKTFFEDMVTDNYKKIMKGEVI